MYCVSVSILQNYSIHHQRVFRATVEASPGQAIQRKTEGKVEITSHQIEEDKVMSLTGNCALKSRFKICLFHIMQVDNFSHDVFVCVIVCLFLMKGCDGVSSESVDILQA